MRRIGHALHLGARLALDSNLTTTEAGKVIDALSHDLYHTVPNLTDTMIAIVPWDPQGPR